MLIDESHRAVHLSENAGRFLQPAGGPVSIDATDLVRQELRFDLRSALHRAFERGEATLTMPLFVRFNGSAHRVYMQVKPVPGDGDAIRYALVLFIEGEAVEPDSIETRTAGDSRESASETIRQLQEELQLSRSRLRETREASETASEEFRAANEELQSINEEYRSTSEELETSKEELQSINEELQTVNSELKLKLEGVSRAHSDLQNLMAATDLGTLFLDQSLRIKRFTPRLLELFNVTANDEGRPITDFTHQLDYPDLAAHARAVLRDLTPLEREVRSQGGKWYLVRLRPYRTIDDKIDGVVVTFVDITDRRRVEEALRASEESLRQEMRLVELSRAPIFVWDADSSGIVQWNRGSEELYGHTREEVAGKKKEILLHTVVPGSSFAELRRALFAKGTWSGELHHRTKDGRSLIVESQIELVQLEGRHLVLESTRDITERKKWEERQQLLLHELNHRVNNTLAVIQAMARQTLRSTTTRAEFVQLFDGRLAALANAHGLLVASNWQGADLAAIIAGQLSAYLGKDGRRIETEGEPVRLSADCATPLGLVLHELATNAAKYGAFSNSEGKVRLSWQVERRRGARWLTISWQETGGPPPKPPKRRGFGGALIERAVPGAVVHRHFPPSGAICTIDFQLSETDDDTRQ